MSTLTDYSAKVQALIDEAARINHTYNWARDVLQQLTQPTQSTQPTSPNLSGIGLAMRFFGQSGPVDVPIPLPHDLDTLSDYLTDVVNQLVVMQQQIWDELQITTTAASGYIRNAVEQATTQASSDNRLVNVVAPGWPAQPPINRPQPPICIPPQQPMMTPPIN